jgi:hypothetical protein
MSVSADLSNKSSSSKDGNILLQGSDKSPDLYKTAITEKLISNDSKSNKIEKAKWIFSDIENTNVHTQAFGKPIKIVGYTTLDNSNIEKAAKEFLFQNKHTLNIDPDVLQLMSAKFINNRWYLSFAQYYNGIKVLLSNVELRIFKNGNVFAMSSDYYSGINVDLTPSINIENAGKFAVKDLDFVTGKDIINKSENLFILPVKSGTATIYKLVYNFDINLKSQNKSYFSYIDANTGEVVWRQNKIFSAITEIKLEGNIRTKNSFSPETKMPMANQYITVGDSIYTSDKNGNISVNIDKPTVFETNFSGTNVIVINDDKPNTNIKDSIYPNQTKNFVWSDANSLKQQRYLYHYANYIHDYIKSIDPELSCMDFQLQINILYDLNSANASSDGKNLQYWGANAKGYHFAETPEILYHEYGHSITTLLYQSLGKQDGMVNGACHEALADITAALVNDIPKVGIGAFDDTSKIIRTVQNSLKYPNNITGESHDDGQILAGAFWDLRKAVSLDYARHISHFARYGTPDDPETGLAFSKWLFETIVADDDDGDLTNGTPHIAEIIESFEKHGIYGYIYSYNTFSHIPPGATQDTVNPYIMNFSIQSLPVLYSLDSVSCNYSIDNLKTMHKVLAVKAGESNYIASIPAHPRGTVIKYYFSAWNQNNQKSINYSQDMNSITPYKLIVGYERALLEDFEKYNGWKTGDKNDDASAGLWERNIPEEAILQFMISETETLDMPVQPGKNHTENGKFCLVTDHTGGKSVDMMDFMPQGTTTITSPVYDMSKLKNPVINYYRWFFNKPITIQTGALFTSEISFNGGNKWTQVERVNNSSEWEKCTITVNDFGIPSNKMMLRFRVRNTMTSYGYPAGFAEALVDDLEIMTGNDAVLSTSVEDNSANISEIDLNFYPNPVNNFAIINYNVKYNSLVVIILINSLGETISTILDEYKQAGSYNLEWYANNSNNKIVPGMYFVQLCTQTETKTTKILIY